MRRRDAIRLKPGDRVVVDDPDEFHLECEDAVVVHVTPRGGVLVRAPDGSTGYGLCAPSSSLASRLTKAMNSSAALLSLKTSRHRNRSLRHCPISGE